jgi:hypothetical protein
MSFDAVHDLKDPQALLLALRGALRAGGAYLIQDIGGSATLANNPDFPLATLLYGISCVALHPDLAGPGG